MEQELNTWRLLLTLFQVQHLDSEEVDSNILSDQDLSEALFKEDQKLKGVIHKICPFGKIKNTMLNAIILTDSKNC